MTSASSPAQRTVFSRSLAREAAPSPVTLLQADWNDTEALLRAIRADTHARGPFARAVLWIHSDAPEAIPAIASHLTATSPAARVYHIVGVQGTPPEGDQRTARFAPAFPTLTWRRVVLGHVPLVSGWRWLTHDEISRGVLHALDSVATETLVGQPGTPPDCRG